ncbi:hypothetical protein V491_05524, partial [Pseudogymnoascus sp. VKM F-3775]
MEDSLTATAYLLASEEGRRTEIVEGVVKGLEDASIKLGEVVLAMHDPLFSDDVEQRTKAMEYLAAILHLLKPDTLTRPNVKVIVEYIQNRLGLDNAGLKESAQALRYLVAMARFDSSLASPLLSAVFNAVQDDFSKAPVMQRFEVYNLFNELLSRQREAMKETGVDFINMVVELSTTERDPRNLMLIFSMVEVILSEWKDEDIEQLKEDLYEMLSRYFPITFTAKKSDPAGINPAELVLRLRKCFAAYGGFAPSLFPNLIQRLDDPNRLNAKADVLLTMKACIKRYSPDIVAKWSTPLWDALKYEIFNSSDDSQAPKALRVLRAIATRLSGGDLTLQTLISTVLHTYVTSIVDECMSRLHENGPKYSASAGAIMSSIISASPFAYHLVNRAALPVLLRDFAERDLSVDEKRAVIDTINALLDGKYEAIRRQAKWEFSSVAIIDAVSYEADDEAGDGYFLGVEDRGLLYYRDELTLLFMSIARDTQSDDKQYRVAAVQGLAKMLGLAHLLERVNVESCIEFLAGVVLETADTKEPVRREAIKALQVCAAPYATLVIDKALPVLLAALPDVLETEESVTEKLAVLQALGDIGSRGILMDTLFRRLLSKLDIVIKANESQKYGQLVLAGILYTVDQRQAQKEEVDKRDVDAYKSLVEELLRRTAALKVNGKAWFVGTRDLETAAGKVQSDEGFLDLVGRIIMAATSSMSFDDQEWIFSRAFSLNVAYDDVSAECITGSLELPPDHLTFASTLDSTLVKDPLVETDVSKRDDIHDAQFDLQSGPVDKLRALMLTKYILAALRRDDRVTKPIDSVTGPKAAVGSPVAAVIASVASPALSPGGPARKRALSVNTSAAATNLVTYLTNTASSPALRSALLDVLALLVNKFAALTPTVKDKLIDLFTALPTLSAQEAKLTIQVLTTVTHAALLAGLPSATALTNSLLTALTLPVPTGQLAAQAFTHLLAPSPLLTASQHALIRPLARQRLFHTAVPALLSTFSTATEGSTKTNALVALSGLLAHAPEDFITPFIDSLIPPLLQSLDTAPGATKRASIAVLRSAALSSPKSLQAHDAALVKRLVACANSEGREVKVQA